MKKRNVIVFLVLIIALVGVYVAYAVYDDIFPKAEKIDFPDYSSVESLTVSQHGETISMSQEDSKMLYEYIRCAKPTRIMSANETPSATLFYTVVIKSDRISVYGNGYIYEERGQAYFEIPYVGIYALDSDAIGVIKKT